MIEEIKNPDCPIKDLTQVDENKPLGSLSPRLVGTRAEIAQLLAQLDTLQISYLEVKTSITDDGTVLMAFNKTVLGKLLQSHEKLLKENGWPITCHEFVIRVATEIVPLSSPVFDVVTEAFGNNPEETRRAIENPMQNLWNLGKW